MSSVLLLIFVALGMFLMYEGSIYRNYYASTFLANCVVFAGVMVIAISIILYAFNH